MDPQSQILEPTQAPPTNPVQPEVAKSKLSGTIVFLSMLSFIFAGSTGFLAYQNMQLQQQISSLQKPIATPIPVETPDPTSGWLTYTNSIYKLSFKYPSTSEIKTCGLQAAIATGNDKECIYIDDLQTGDSTIFTSLDFKSKPTKQTFTDYISANIKGFEPTTQYTSLIKTVSEKPAYEIITEASKSNTYKTKIIIIEQSETNVVWFSGRYDTPDTVALFDQILATLSFTN